MSDSSRIDPLTFGTPGHYKIEVEGTLDECLSDHLAGMQITTREREDKSVVTALVGRLRDQAELAGVLNSLYELHCTILSVQNMAAKLEG